MKIMRGEQNKMDKKIIAIIILSLILVVALSYVVFIKANDYLIVNKEEHYTEGYNQGQYDIINKINTDGEVPIVYEENDQLKINWVKLTNE